MTADLVIPGNVLEQAKYSAAELLLDLAVFLYAAERFSIGQARRLAGLDHVSFQKELSRRGIALHFEIEDLHDDLQTLGIPTK